MKKICIYGKGGIGKSTVVSNVAAALACTGLKVAVVGCDPKADSTRNLTRTRTETVLNCVMRGEERFYAYGFKDVLCIESGGPEPGTGCAGRGIVSALTAIREKICWQIGMWYFSMCWVTWYAADSAPLCGSKWRTRCIS